MFLRDTKRKKNGKEHRYFSVVENRRLADGRTQQRQVVYLGEINDSQQAAWRRSLQVFDEDRGGYRELSLFPDDRLIPPDAADALSVKLSQMQLRHPRAFGDCWLGCRLWEELELGRFWAERLAKHQGDVPWEKVVQVLAVSRLCDPGSEFRVHRQWFGQTAMGELLASAVSSAERAWARPSRARTGSTAAWTCWSSTRTSCAACWPGGGGRYSTRASTCCCTT
jgi:hypothetical protein